MRVLIISRLLWTAGAQRIAINEYHWLKRLGYDTELVFLRRGNVTGYEELLEEVNYKVVRRGHGPLTPFFYTLTKIFAPDRGLESTVDLDLIFKIPKIAKKEGADYLICHDQFTGIGCYQAYRKYGIPYTIFIHEKVVNYRQPIFGKIINNIEKEILLNAKKVFAVTDKVAQTINEKHGIKAIPNYPGMDKISERHFSEKEDVLLAVSFWDLGRRPWDYLEVVKHLDYKLILAGNWRVKKAKEKVVESIKLMGLKDKVSLVEGISENQLRELYNKAKFVIRFGYGEFGPAISVIEAIQHTTPVIINDELGTAELVKRYNLGLVVHGIDVRSIKEFINKIDEKTYSQLQDNIKKVQNIYTWLNHVTKLIDTITFKQ
ncbi:glycosyltransferase (type 1) [Pyrobaculum aerophilum str. IM2]|uniref:Glycosyltransferase (Type 1) n=2 Tax=Pyrobaculum aerophilum TaxID=13773 RepID=Q8ZZ44_PYRAE|nr:glycosyltransferase family 4 protein [Pyrobaculum aerophilum]AAL62797.1 glycosyltransferase (type 1) [Pyrobaculum aerophilum str. IM2]HII46858.1 glycosyltransferase family 4 protein [Pyrobaculum aerophilum]